MRWLAFAAALAAASGSTACARPSDPPELPAGSVEITLQGQQIYPVRASPAPAQLRLGGLSGITGVRAGRELIGISDDHEYPRAFRLRVIGEGATFRVESSGVIFLGEAAGSPVRLDPEAIALTRNGHLLIASEGFGDEEPRLPPAIFEYSNDGLFMRGLPVRPRYAPTERGALTSGVRNNAGFEALTVTTDFSRLFTATELPLVQDGDAEAFATGVRSRLLEYVEAGDSYVPRREFVYEIEPMERPGFDVRFAVNGLVELLSLGGEQLLAMERGFAESSDPQQAVNSIRIFLMDLRGATDVSSHDSLKEVADIVPVRKTLVLDLSRLPGLPARLAKLDNFEGMAWGPRLPDGKRSLILVSDDNFSARQVTAFLQLRVANLR